MKWIGPDPRPDCILVKPTAPKMGYRRVMRNGVVKNAAVWALEDHLGRPLKDGYLADHLCRVRNCVNPLHLEEVTRAENSRRGAIGNRTKRLGFDVPCPRGHTFDFWIRPNGGRMCRPCQREKSRLFRAKQRSQA